MDNRERTKIMVGFGLLMAASLVPGLILALLNLPTLASVTTLSALGALIPALMISTRAAWVTAAAMTAAAAVALPASTEPWLAAVVLGAAGAFVGVASRWGASGFVVLAAIGVVFLIAEPPTLPSDVPPVTMLTAATAVSAMWGVGAGTLIRRRRRSTGLPAPEAMPWSRAGAYAIILMLVLAVAGWWTVHLQLQHGGAWFLMTFLIILQPYLQDSLSRTVHRATGTVIGVIVAMVLYLLMGPWPVLLYVVGSIAAIAALTIRYTTKRPYWQYVTLLTPAVVLLEGMSSSVVDTAEERVGFTLLAAVIAVLIELLLRPGYRRAAVRVGADRY
jgi:hypothetical protein